MSEFKGTKGSWVLTPKTNRIIIGNSIADVWGFDAHIDDKANEKMEANALLISKAPEMLEMLISVKEHLNDDDKWSVEQLIKQATEI